MAEPAILIVVSPVAALLWVLPSAAADRAGSAGGPTSSRSRCSSPPRRNPGDGPFDCRCAALRTGLSLGTALMVELTPGSLSNALLTLMLGIAVCWLTLKVPSLLRSRHSQAGLFNVITLVAASRAVGAIGGAAAGGGAAAAGGAAAGRVPRAAPAGGRA